MFLRKMFKKSLLSFFSTKNFCPSAAQSWIYGQKTQLFNVELANILNNLKSSNPEFVILDVRELFEIEAADLPDQNESGITIPKIHMSIDDLLAVKENNYPNIPKDKYIICLCHHGIRSAKAAFHLKNRGYKTLNLYGGIDQLSKVMKDIPNY